MIYSFPFRLGMIFLLITVGLTSIHAASYIFSDFRSLSAAGGVWIAIGIYQTLTLISMSLGLFALRINSFENATLLHSPYHKKMLPLLLVISSIGLAFHVFSKLYPVDLNDVSCITDLREAWLYSDRSSHPIWLRLMSISGHLLSSFHYPGVFLSSFMLTCKERERSSQYIFFIAFLTIGLIYACVIFSRTVIVTTFTIILLGLAFGLLIQRQLVRQSLKLLLIPVALSATVAVCFIMGVFAIKMDCASRDFKEKNVSDINYINGYEDELLYISKSDGTLLLLYPLRKAIRNSLPTCTMTMIYTNHGIWNFETISSSKKRGDPILFQFVHYWMSKLLSIKSPVIKKRVYGLGGATLPGSAFHDYGWMGLILTSLAHGILISVSVWLISLNDWRSAFGIVGFVASGLNSVFCLLFVAPAIMTFPFVIFAFASYFLSAAMMDRLLY